MLSYSVKRCLRECQGLPSSKNLRSFSLFRTFCFSTFYWADFFLSFFYVAREFNRFFHPGLAEFHFLVVQQQEPKCPKRVVHVTAELLVCSSNLLTFLRTFSLPMPSSSWLLKLSNERAVVHWRNPEIHSVFHFQTEFSCADWGWALRREGKTWIRRLQNLPHSEHKWARL